MELGSFRKSHPERNTSRGSRLRDVFNRVLKDHGRYVLIAHRNYQIPCVCNPVDRSHCPYCLGTGATLRLEKRLSYDRIVTQPDRLSNVFNMSPLTVAAIEARVCYFSHDTSLAPGDLIAATDLSDKPESLILVTGFYEVNHAEPFDAFGERIYWVASCSQDPVESEIRRIHLVKRKSLPIPGFAQPADPYLYLPEMR
jgi:hypothetical protein